jgi:hypothetical protein
MLISVNEIWRTGEFSICLKEDRLGVSVLIRQASGLSEVKIDPKAIKNELSDNPEPLLSPSCKSAFKRMKDKK